MKQRNYTFDFLCGLCIIRTVVYHLVMDFNFTGSTVWMLINHWTFYLMSFFFFKAGYFNKRVDGDTKEFVLGKTRQLMVPYFVWGIIGCIIYFTFAFLILPDGNHYVTSLTLSHLWTTSCFYGNGPLWFLMSFYVMYLMVHAISKLPPVNLRSRTISWDWIVLFFPCVSMLLAYFHNPLPLDLDNVFYTVFLFYLGKYWRKFMDNTDKRVAICTSVALLVAFFFLNTAFDISHVVRTNVWHGNPMIILIAMVSVICGLSGLLLSLDIKRVPVICFIGEHSMVFFVAHRLVTTVYEMTMEATGHTVKGDKLNFFILMALCFTICSFLVKYVERVPFLSGRYPKKVAAQ